VVTHQLKSSSASLLAFLSPSSRFVSQAADEATFNCYLVSPGVRVERYWVNYTGEQEATIKEYLDGIYEGGTPVPESFRVQLDAPYDRFWTLLSSS
jgi:hypothetical protein